MKGLSKSRYMAFCQCPRMMWLNVYQSETDSSDSDNQINTEQGNEVGEFAKALFGEYSDATICYPDGSRNLGAMIEFTRNEMETGAEVICEASFSFEGNFCSVDILRHKGDGWAIYEVKSTTYKSDEKPKNLLEFATDVAYQKRVLEKCGIKVTGTYLVRLDSAYVRRGKINIHKLFHIKDISNLVENEYIKVTDNVYAAREVLENSDEPEVVPGQQCTKNHKCRYFNHCVGELPEPNVFELNGTFVKTQTKWKLFHSGKKSFEDLQHEKFKSSAIRKHIACYLNDEDFVDTEKIVGFLKGLSFPLYFLDFETMKFPIPIYDGTRPYQQLPFQYSLHWLDEPDGELHHTEFLGNAVDDPRRELAEQLCRDIPGDACVTAYNMSFEKGRLEELAKAYPDLAPHLLSIRGNIKDLEDPFKQCMHYRPAMNGSSSIKKVLPALFPDDPELNYANLEGSIHHGGDAMTAYPAMASMEPEEAAATRKALLEYCRLDTLAMVRIYQHLRELTGAQ